MKMIERLEFLKTDLFFQSPEKLEQLQDQTLDVNYNSLNLVITTLTKVYEKSISLSNNILESQKSSGDIKKMLKKLFILTSKLHNVDYYVWTSMI